MANDEKQEKNELTIKQRLTSLGNASERWILLLGTAGFFTFLGTIIEKSYERSSALTLERQKYEYSLISGIMNKQFELEMQVVYSSPESAPDDSSLPDDLGLPDNSSEETEENSEENQNSQQNPASAEDIENQKRIENIIEKQERISRDEAARQLLFLVNIGVIKSLDANQLKKEITEGTLPSNLPAPQRDSFVPQSRQELLNAEQARISTGDGSDALIFSGPGINYDLLGLMPHGAAVTLTGRTQEQWSELEEGGWIHTSFLIFSSSNTPQNNETEQ